MVHLHIGYLTRIVSLAVLLFSSFITFAQNRNVNYDESKIPAYTLPDPLRLANGKKITAQQQWVSQQRQTILELFKKNVYGEFPAPLDGIKFNTLSVDSTVLNGKAVRKQIRINFPNQNNDEVYIDVLMYVPLGSSKPSPVCLGLNFQGNQAVAADTGINITTRWVMARDKGVVNNRVAEEGRGAEARRWPVEAMIARGYAVATAYYGDMEPDHADGWKTGIRTHLADQLKLAPEKWSAMGAWGWGLCRILDYLETDKSVDAKKVVLTGHSRLGKAALWAGVNDERFAVIVSNNSGEGGAALSKRWYGETIEIITNAFPHWFIPKYKTFSNNTASLPLDQHMLLSLVAPRPLYVASASEDQWADPKGEFLAAKNAEPVYKLFGKKGLGTDTMPAANQPVGETIGYHLRKGEHDILLYDWEQYMNFADRHFKN
jgi:hypothetical protein